MQFRQKDDEWCACASVTMHWGRKPDYVMVGRKPEIMMVLKQKLYHYVDVCRQRYSTVLIATLHLESFIEGVSVEVRDEVIQKIDEWIGLIKISISSKIDMYSMLIVIEVSGF